MLEGNKFSAANLVLREIFLQYFRDDIREQARKLPHSRLASEISKLRPLPDHIIRAVFLLRDYQERRRLPGFDKSQHPIFSQIRSPVGTIHDWITLLAHAPSSSEFAGHLKALKDDLALVANLTRNVLLLHGNYPKYATVDAALDMYVKLSKKENVTQFAAGVARKRWAQLRPVSHFAVGLDCVKVDIHDLWNGKAKYGQVIEAIGYASVVGERLQTVQPAQSRKANPDLPFVYSMMQTELASSLNSYLPKMTELEPLEAYLVPDQEESGHLQAFRPKDRYVVRKAR